MSDTTTVAAVDVTSEGDAASASENPNISCNRCGTLTTWNPYCPSCGAYLEFSGTPAWHPDEQLSTIPPITAVGAHASADDTSDTAAGTAPSTLESSTSSTGDASPSDGTPSAESAAVGDAGDSSEHLEPAHRHRLGDLFHRGERKAEAAEKATELEAEKATADAEKHLEHDIAEAKSNIHDDLHPTEHEIKPWWASWGETPTAPDNADDTDAGTAPAAKVSASSGIAPDPEVNDGVVFTSRRVVPAPAIVEPDATLPGLPEDETQKTRAMGNEELDADGETCARCELKNPAGRQYCDWCGTPLPGVVLGPENDAYNPYGIKSSGTVEVSSAPRRSYAVKIIVLIVVLLTLIWAIWYFFFGPRAEQTTTAIKVTTQKFTEWLAPSIGAQATITNVTASSSLQGTSPLALSEVSSRDFWASAPMTLYGAGSSVTFTLDKKYEIDRVAIYPGIQNQTFDVNALGTPADVTIDVGDGKVHQAHVSYIQSDSDYEQILQIPTVVTDTVKITFDTVYPPRYPDPKGETVGEVSVSAFAFLQVPSATTVNPLASASASPSASGSASASPSASSSASGSASASPSSSASASASAKPKSSASASATKSSSAKPKSSPSPSPKPSTTPSPQPSSTPAVTPTPSPTQ
jgi:hypothetical protein